MFDPGDDMAKGRSQMRILFEVLLLSILIGAVVLFYRLVMHYLFTKSKEKEDGR